MELIVSIFSKKIKAILKKAVAICWHFDRFSIPKECRLHAINDFASLLFIH
jgi:hypothetical protein